ncbi:MAG TPA: aldo/keto reductase [Pyrinomonadaceae bacterium]|nr:aldo/keto reductase [Pyrinomonadaceae bacterium]
MPAKHGLVLSSIGIGTYLGNADDATDLAYTRAIIRAVQLGVNVIDTAANYRFQRSERSIGEALRVLANEHGIAREELFICTKGGYLPFDGAPPRNVAQYVNETFVKPGIASFEDFVGGGHCMTPAYLQNQLDQSLKNMGVESVDVYYIHNPESQLPHVSEQEFYARLKRAFERLEENRKQGKLVHYGVATWNGFRMPPDSGQYHSLTRMVELAREVAGDQHGFHFIQLPFNVKMPEATTVIEEAQQLGVSVVTSASLLQGRIPPQMAVEFVRSTPGITTALIGMSRVEHVEQNLATDLHG